MERGEEQSAGVVLVRRRRRDLKSSISGAFALYKDLYGGESPLTATGSSEDADGADIAVEVLAIRRSSNLFELPKGHVEVNESLVDAARRELREETGLLNDIVVGARVGMECYLTTSTRLPHKGHIVHKEVSYFEGHLKPSSSDSLVSEEVLAGQREKETKTVCWLELDDLKHAQFRSRQVKELVRDTLTAHL